MVVFCKRYAFLIGCVLLMGFMSSGDVIRLPKEGSDAVKDEIVWEKATDQRITFSSRNMMEQSSSEPPRPDAAVSLSSEKETYLQQLAMRQGQGVAAEYRAVLTGYEVDKTAYDIVLFGDSLTYRGEWSEISDRLTVANRGINGDMISGLEHRIDQVARMNPRALFLMIGINDLSVRMRPEVYEAYARLLDRLMLELPETEIYVQSILPVRDDLRNIMSNDVIAMVNEQIKQMCAARGLCYIDVYAEMLNPEERRLYYNYQLDGLHLSEQGYDVWKQVIKPYITRIEWQAAVERAELDKARRRALVTPKK